MAFPTEPQINFLKVLYEETDRNTYIGVLISEDRTVKSLVNRGLLEYAPREHSSEDDSVKLTQAGKILIEEIIANKRPLK